MRETAAGVVTSMETCEKSSTGHTTPPRLHSGQLERGQEELIARTVAPHVTMTAVPGGPKLCPVMLSKPPEAVSMAEALKLRPRICRGGGIDSCAQGIACLTTGRW